MTAETKPESFTRIKKHRFRTVDTESRVVEITSRTMHGLYRLRPSKRVNDLIVGVLGRAQAKYDVELYCFVFMSNHFHLLMKAQSVKQMSRFVGFLKTNIASELRRVHGWKGPVWGRRFSHSSVGTTQHDQAKRLFYLLDNGCKEGLVASPLDWPGASSARALWHGEESLLGTWFDRTAQDRERLCGRKALFPSTQRVRLSPLPFLAEYSPGERRQFMRDAVQHVEAKTAASHLQSKTKPVGARSVLRENPMASPRDFHSSPAPRFLTSDPHELSKMRFAREIKQIAYAIAADKLERGHDDFVFPQDCFPPGLPFVPSTAPT